VDTLRACNIRKAFMASTGITAENGATQSLSIEFSIKKTAVEHSEQIILMVENRKFGVVSLLTYCPASDIDTIVTDVQPPQDFCRAYGGRIITP